MSAATRLTHKLDIRPTRKVDILHIRPQRRTDNRRDRPRRAMANRASIISRTDIPTLAHLEVLRTVSVALGRP